MPVRQHACHPNLPGSPFTQNDRDESISSYAACTGGVGSVSVDNDGLFFLNSQIRYRNIPDGASYTLAVAEVADRQSLNWTSGTRATLRNTGQALQGYRWTPQSDAADSEKSDTTLSVGGYSSFHPGVVMSVFADGSVQFLSLNIDSEVLSAMGGREDGVLFSRQQ